MLFFCGLLIAGLGGAFILPVRPVQYIWLWCLGGVLPLLSVSLQKIPLAILRAVSFSPAAVRDNFKSLILGEAEELSMLR